MYRIYIVVISKGGAIELYATPQPTPATVKIYGGDVPVKVYVNGTLNATVEPGTQVTLTLEPAVYNITLFNGDVGRLVILPLLEPGEHLTVINPLKVMCQQPTQTHVENATPHIYTTMPMTVYVKGSVAAELSANSATETSLVPGTYNIASVSEGCKHTSIIVRASSGERIEIIDPLKEANSSQRTTYTAIKVVAAVVVAVATVAAAKAIFRRSKRRGR